MSNDFNMKSLQDFEEPLTFLYKHKIPSELIRNHQMILSVISCNGTEIKL
jgi:hypothetical protein